MKNIVTLFIFALVSGNLYPQNKCVVNLRIAEQEYEMGRIERVPLLLQPCLQTGINAEDKVRAMRLMVLCYLYENKEDSAEYMMEQLLRTQPGLSIDPQTEDARFVKLFKTYRTEAVRGLGVTGGIMRSRPRILQQYGINPAPVPSTGRSVGNGIYMGVAFTQYLFPHLEMYTELRFAREEVRFNEQPLEFADVSYTETNDLLELPLMLTYFRGTGQFRYFVEAGFTTSVMMRAWANPQRTYNNQGVVSHSDISGSQIQVYDQRRHLQLTPVLGIGFRRQFKRSYFFGKINYAPGLINHAKADSRYNNPDLLYEYYYVDDDFVVNRLSYSAGYVFLFYKPEKIKE